MSSKELVDHPDHYGGKDDPYEHVKVAEALGWTEDAFIYNCTKYIWRCGRKEGAPTIRDLQKARWYLDRKIQQMEKAGKVAAELPLAPYHRPKAEIEVPDPAIWPQGRQPKYGESFVHKGHQFIWGILEGGRGSGWILYRTPDEARRVPRDAPVHYSPKTSAGPLEDPPEVEKTDEWVTAPMPA